jgi:hypothetical protein
MDGSGIHRDDSHRVTPGGRELDPLMPAELFAKMTDDELKAVWLYLQSLPALEQGE